MDTIGCFKKSCLCFCLKSMPVTQTDRNGNGRWRPEGGPGPRLSTAVCSSCFLLGLIRFLCWLRADRDVVMASVSGWLKKKKKQDQHVLHFPNENTGKKQRLPSEHRCAQKWLCVLPWVTVYDGPGGWHGPRGSGRGPRGAGCPAHPERPWGGLCSLQPGKPAAPASRIPPRRRHGSQSFPHSGEGQGRPDPAPGSQWNALDGAKETKHVRKVCWRPCSSPLPLVPRGLPAPALASQVALGLWRAWL